MKHKALNLFFSSFISSVVHWLRPLPMICGLHNTCSPPSKFIFYRHKFNLIKYSSSDSVLPWFLVRKMIICSCKSNLDLPSCPHLRFSSLSFGVAIKCQNQITFVRIPRLLWLSILMMVYTVQWLYCTTCSYSISISILDTYIVWLEFPTCSY